MRAYPGGTVVKNLTAKAWDAGDVCLILGLTRSSGVGNCSPLQYSCLENYLDRWAWWAAVHGITKNWTWLSDWAPTHAHIYEWLYFWDLSSVSLIYVSVFLPIPYCFDYYSCVYNVKSGSMITSNFVLMIALVIWGLLWFQINFLIFCSISGKNVFGIFIGIVVNL